MLLEFTIFVTIFFAFRYPKIISGSGAKRMGSMGWLGVDGVDGGRGRVCGMWMEQRFRFFKVFFDFRKMDVLSL